jgi:HAD superfamily hydrolase (TIGR01509 family)
MEPELVIFDCDGVLIDSELLAAQADVACLAAEGFCLSTDEVLDRYAGISLADMIMDLQVRRGRPVSSVAEFENRHQRHLSALFEVDLKPIPGVGEVLNSLPCKVCVASSSVPERIRHGLSIVGLLERLEPNIFSASMVEHGKPAPDLFLHAAARMGIEPQRSVVIEDSQAGIVAAGAAGMRSIGFVGGSHCRAGHGDRLYACGASLVIDHMSSLLPALGYRGGR